MNNATLLRRYLPLLAVLALTAVPAAVPASAQISIAALDSTITEDFNAFRAAGFQPEPTAGQLDSDAFLVQGTSDEPSEPEFGFTSTTGDFARGTASGRAETGGVYAFQTAPGDFSLGLQPTSSDFAGGNPSIGVGYIAVRFQNNTGATIRSIRVSYDVKSLNDQGRSSIFDGYYATGASGVFNDFFNTASFNGELQFATPTTADASPAWQTTPFDVEVGQLSVAPGEYVLIALVTQDNLRGAGSGNRDQLALDNLTLTASDALPADAAVSLLLGDAEGEGNDAGWRMLAAPVEGVTVGDLAAENLVEGIAGTAPAAEPNLLLTYDGSGVPVGFTTPDSASAATEIRRGEGFVWYFADSTSAEGSQPLPDMYDTTGPVRQGDVVAEFRPTADGFYLAGNPFETSLRLRDVGVVRYGKIRDVVQVWSPSGGAAPSSFGTYVPLRRVLADSVAAGQGFLLEISTLALDGIQLYLGGRADVTFPAEARTSGAPIYGRTAQAPAYRLIEFALDGTRVVDRAAAVFFTEDATDDYDLYDAAKLLPFGEEYALIAALGVRGGSPQLRAQESRPFDPAAFTLPFALNVSGEAGPLTLTWPTFENIPPEWGVVLTDLVTGATADLQEDTSYAFTADPTNWTERFSLAVTPRTVADEGDGAPRQSVLSAVRPNPARDAARLSLSLAAPESVTVEVLDVLGRRVALVHEGALAAGTHALSVETAALPAGTYVVRATSASLAAVRRFTVLR